MKVTAFIRKTSAKNNVTDLARVYFRVRDIGGVDIKAASELSINPNHWSAEKQGVQAPCGFGIGREADELRQRHPADNPSYHQGIPPWRGRQLAQRADRGIPSPQHQRKGRQQGRRIPPRLSNQQVYHRKHFGG